MLNEAINCTNCDTTCYQTCTSCTADCSSDCSSSCSGTCESECTTSCSGCTGSCISTCMGSCSNTCDGDATSSTIDVTYKTLNYSYYYYAYDRPKIVRVTDKIFLMFIAYSSDTRSQVQAVAFTVDDNYNITFGTNQALVPMNLLNFETISSYDIESCTCNQVIVASNIESSTIIVFTINIDDDLNLTVGTSTNIDSTSTPTIQYAQYTLGFTPTGAQNFIKLIEDSGYLYFVSISNAKQASVCIGTISSSGVTLRLSSEVSLNLYSELHDPSDNPELFFSNSLNYAGALSINNYYQSNGTIYMFSMSNAVTSGSILQTHAFLLSFSVSWIGSPFQIEYVINSETPFIADILHLEDNYYAIIDELYARTTNTVDKGILRATIYELENGVFRQCSGGKIWKGILANSPQNYSAIFESNSIVTDDNGIVICASFYDNIKHTRNRRYLCSFSYSISTHDHSASLYVNSNYIAGDGEYDFGSAIGYYDIAVPLNMTYIHTAQDGHYILAVDRNNDTNTATVMLFKILSDGNVSSGVYNAYKLYSPSTSNYAFWQKNILQDLGGGKYRFFYWRGSTSHGYPSEFTVITLDLSPCDEDYNNSPIVSVIDHSALITNTVSGVTASNIGCNNLITNYYPIPEIFHNDIICFAYSNVIYTYRWNRDDNKFYMLDMYISNVTIPSTNSCYYYKNEWCRKYSDNELLLFDTNYRYYELLQIQPSGKIINMGFISAATNSNNKYLISQIYCPSIKMLKHNEDLYFVNHSYNQAYVVPNNSATSLVPIHINKAFSKLASYVIGNSGKNPFGLSIDESSNGEVCKTVIPDVE